MVQGEVRMGGGFLEKKDLLPDRKKRFNSSEGNWVPLKRKKTTPMKWVHHFSRD